MRPSEPTAQPFVELTMFTEKRCFVVGLVTFCQFVPSHLSIMPLSPTAQASDELTMSTAHSVLVPTFLGLSNAFQPVPFQWSM